MSLHSIAQLDERIRLAKQLGFWDDVAHWEAEKRRITGAAEVRSTDTTAHDRDRMGICRRCGQGITAKDLLDGEERCDTTGAET